MTTTSPRLSLGSSMLSIPPPTSAHALALVAGIERCEVGELERYAICISKMHSVGSGRAA